MAAWNGHVYYIESRWKYHTDNHTTIASPVDVAGVWIGLQLNMRHLDFGRTFYKMVPGGNDFGIEWGGVDSNLWSNTGTATYIGSAVGVTRPENVCVVDDIPSDFGYCDCHHRGVLIQLLEYIRKSSNPTLEGSCIWVYKWDLVCAFIAGGQISGGITGPDNHRSRQSVQ